jgi:hypothetical protein
MKMPQNDRTNILSTDGDDALVIYNGGDIKAYSDTGDTLKWSLDASTGAVTAPGTGATLNVGTFASAAVGGTVLSASRTKAVSFYADDGNAAIVTGNNVRTTVNRFLLLHAAGADVTISGCQNQLKIATTAPTTTSPMSGAYDYLEIAAAATIGSAQATRSCVDAGSNAITVSTALAAVRAECVFNAAITETGSISGVYIGKAAQGSTYQWPQALYIGAADKFVKFATGTAYECGVKIGSMTAIGTSGVAGTADGLIKIDVAGTAYYIPIVAAASVTGE